MSARPLICALCLSLIAGASLADEPAVTAAELLDKMANAWDMEQPVWITASTTSVSSETGTSLSRNCSESEFIFDGKRSRRSTRLWSIGEDGPTSGTYTARIYLEKTSLEYVRNIKRGSSHAIWGAERLARQNAERAERARIGSLTPQYSYSGTPFLVHQQPPEKIAAARVAPEMVEIDGYPCYLVEMNDTEHGNLKFWIDPEWGYHIRRYEHMRERPEKVRIGTLLTLGTVIDRIEIEKVEGRFFLTTFRSTVRAHYRKPGYGAQGKSHHVFSSGTTHRVLESLNPNIEALNPFHTSFIPERTELYVRDRMAGYYEWRNGAIRPVAGR